MTKEEAEIVATIVASADNYCPHCVHDLVLQLQEKLPEFDWKELTGTKK